MQKSNYYERDKRRILISKVKIAGRVVKMLRRPQTSQKRVGKSFNENN